MTRHTWWKIGLIAIAMVVMASLLPLTADGDISDNYAMIIVSDFDGVNRDELDKAGDLYDLLIGQGYSKDNILLLTPKNITGTDDTPTTSNIEDGFEWIINETDSRSDVLIYVSDHSHATESDTIYRFSDGNISDDDVTDWIDEMECSSLAYLTTGNCSGLFGSLLSGERRVIMSSMGENQKSKTDHFNIARGLENISADMNNDGYVTFVEAFYWEKTYINERWEQDPKMWAE